MGACGLSVFIKTKSEPDFFKKFDRLREEARIEYGTNPYSGSWATIDSARIVPDPCPEMKLWTKKKFYAVARKLSDSTIKWESASAVKTPYGYFVFGWGCS